ncbi:hypothetical protein N0V82_004965 [Gnomoniopsis sp. IMI 355080]|nr:hypothetical protein N0V82_004965 [Gnomoniopsis sp. IMI 355080]
MRSLYPLITLSLSIFISSAVTSPQQVPISGAIPFTFRNATLDDLDDITTVFLDAFSRAPSWGYVRQFADIYPDYTWNCLREMFNQTYLNNSEMAPGGFKVITVPDQLSYRKEKVVSISIWDFNYLRQASDKSLLSTSLAGLGVIMPSRTAYNVQPAVEGFDCKAHLDMNITRARQVEEVMKEAGDKYLLKPYGQQLVLALLATHPDWDGNGFAARHIHWGKETLAEINHGPEHLKHRVPLTLIGTPAGYPLYVSEGFEGVRNITIERLDGKGIIWMEAMKYEQEEN